MYDLTCVICNFTCFVFVPLQIFLEPLASVVGKTKSKESVLGAAQTTAQRSRLQALGCALGVDQWVASFEDRKRWPRDCLQREESLDDILGGPMEVRG